MKRMFLIGLLLLLVVPTFAQQKTAYQKKVEAIENKYLQQVGIPLSEINRLRKDKDFGEAMLRGMFNQKLATYSKKHGSIQAYALITKIADEMKAAEKLKTPAELKKEKEEKQRQIIQQQKREEQEKLAKTKREQELQEKRLKEEQEREAKRLEEEEARIRKKQESLRNTSDIAKIKARIKDNFLKWAQKGEFETTNEFKERLQNNGKEKIQEISSDIVVSILRELRFYINLGKYNADEEIYPITIGRSIPIYSYKTEEELHHILTANDDYRGYNYTEDTISVESNLKIGKEEAIQLKEEIKYYASYYNDQMSAKYIYYDTSKIFFSNDIKRWILKDAYLLPIDIKNVAKIRGENTPNFIIKSEYDLDIKEEYPLLSELQFSTSELELSEYFPEEYTFTLDNEKIKKGLREEYF
ncbi:hypothetical protein JMN11_08750 [Capnocytophaga genosp. AHN8471]|jgi:hypothetical protein|uniref:Uncharacterized protein n=1 Tax=Capnocytophaga periodontitidis TaxID=2795027 RepID=A0ABS0SMB6_9FLAO|nr:MULTISPECIES: hypothetical protein [Capnocytophaga]MBI1646908.1 hypothetical protein [Capnocytophaga periodontitidis]MBM0653756.1 hypothetical protein [Capnocytophaga genosp. AHN8471]